MTTQVSIDSVKELYLKLERTFYRRDAYGEYQVDWVFDCAVTAWHLVDWVAQETVSDVKTAQKQFRAKSLELAVCEQICNGAKHLLLDNQKLRPFDVTTDVIGTQDRKGISRSFRAGEDNIDIVLTPVVWITDKDSKRWEAIELFHNVVRFWQRELNFSG